MAPKKPKPTGTITSTGQPANPQMDTLDMNKLGVQYGIAADILDNPENSDVVKVLNKVLADRKAGKQWSDNDIANMLINTNWYKNHLNSWLTVEKDRLSKSEGYWEELISSGAQTVKEQFAKAGSDITDEEARQYATNLQYGSGIGEDGKPKLYDKNWLTNQVTKSIDFGKTKTVAGVQMYDLKGQAETTANDLYKMAQDYGLDTSMTNKTFSSWFEKSATGLMNGTLAKEDVDDELMGIASSRFPGLVQQFQRGLTLREAADPYMKAIADELEYDPEALNFNDDLVQRVLNSSDDQGNFKPMSLYDAKLAARKDKRWQYTGKAKDEYTGMAQTILKDFGFLG